MPMGRKRSPRSAVSHCGPSNELDFAVAFILLYPLDDSALAPQLNSSVLLDHLLVRASMHLLKFLFYQSLVTLMGLRNRKEGKVVSVGIKIYVCFIHHGSSG